MSMSRREVLRSAALLPMTLATMRPEAFTLGEARRLSTFVDNMQAPRFEWSDGKGRTWDASPANWWRLLIGAAYVTGWKLEELFELRQRNACYFAHPGFETVPVRRPELRWVYLMNRKGGSEFRGVQMPRWFEALAVREWWYTAGELGLFGDVEADAARSWFAELCHGAGVPAKPFEALNALGVLELAKLPQRTGEPLVDVCQATIRLPAL